MQFWQPFAKFCDKWPKRFCSISQNDKQYIRSSKKCFSSNCSYGQVEFSFDNPPKVCRKKAQNFLLKIPNWYKKSKSLFSFLMPLWTWRRQFWQHRRKRSDERPKLFGSMSENDLKISFLSEKKIFFLSKCSYGDIEWKFDGTTEIFPTKGEKSSSQCAKMNRKYTFFRKFNFPPTVPLDT